MCLIYRLDFLHPPGQLLPLNLCVCVCAFCLAEWSQLGGCVCQMTLWQNAYHTVPLPLPASADWLGWTALARLVSPKPGRGRDGGGGLGSFDHEVLFTSWPRRFSAYRTETMGLILLCNCWQMFPPHASISSSLTLTCWALMFPELFREPLGCRPSRGLGNITPTTLWSEPALIPQRTDRTWIARTQLAWKPSFCLWNIWQILNIVAVYEVSPVLARFQHGSDRRSRIL